MKKIILILALTAILLSSCFIPDNYNAEVWVHKDGSYEFFYKGELNYAPALEDVINGKFDEEELQDMLDISDDLSKSEGFMEAEHIGGGKFYVDVIITREAGEDYDFISEDLNLFSFHHDEKGKLLISGPQITKDDLAPLYELDIRMSGDLTVKVDKGVKVKSQNADKKIKDKKTGTTYIWKLDIDSEKPEMVVKK